MQVQLNVIQHTDGHRSVLGQTNKQKQQIFKTMTTQRAPEANYSKPAQKPFVAYFSIHFSMSSIFMPQGLC